MNENKSSGKHYISRFFYLIHFFYVNKDKIFVTNDYFINKSNKSEYAIPIYFKHIDSSNRSKTLNRFVKLNILRLYKKSNAINEYKLLEHFQKIDSFIEYLKEVKKQLESKSAVRIAKKETIINMLKIIIYVLNKFNNGQKAYSILIDELKDLNINNLKYYIGFLNIAQALDDFNNHHLTIFKTKLNNYQKDSALMLDKNSQLKKKSNGTYMMSFMVNLPIRSEHNRQTEIIEDIFVVE
jgi:hypothetical protein